MCTAECRIILLIFPGTGNRARNIGRTTSPLSERSICKGLKYQCQSLSSHLLQEAKFQILANNQLMRLISFKTG